MWPKCKNIAELGNALGIAVRFAPEQWTANGKIVFMLVASSSS